MSIQEDSHKFAEALASMRKRKLEPADLALAYRAGAEKALELVGPAVVEILKERILV